MILAAVLLSTMVVIYAMNITGGVVQKEKLYIASTHVWYMNDHMSIAAIAICDTGPTDIVLTNINVKGLQSQWSGTDNYVVYCEINGTMPGDLPKVTSISSTDPTTINIAGTPYDFAPATSEGLTIKAGCSVAFYIVVPDCITIYDLATPVNLVVSTTQCVYCAETAVQAA